MEKKKCSRGKTSWQHCEWNRGERKSRKKEGPDEKRRPPTKSLLTLGSVCYYSVLFGRLPCSSLFSRVERLSEATLLMSWPFYPHEEREKRRPQGTRAVKRHDCSLSPLPSPSSLLNVVCVGRILPFFLFSFRSFLEKESLQSWQKVERGEVKSLGTETPRHSFRFVRGADGRPWIDEGKGPRRRGCKQQFEGVRVWEERPLPPALFFPAHLAQSSSLTSPSLELYTLPLFPMVLSLPFVYFSSLPS